MAENTKLDRRQILKGMALIGGSASLLGTRRAFAQDTKDERFLVVLCGSGGASIIDSLLAIRASECADPSRVNVYEDARVQNIPNSPFRAIDSSGPALGAIPVPFSANQSDFVKKHKDDIMVVTCTGTSVNHAIGQRRAITGNEAWAGRTLQELTALQYGDGKNLANVVLASGTGFGVRGSDNTLPARCYGEVVTTPALWPLSLHSTQGLNVPAHEQVQIARRLRNESLDPESRFARFFQKSPLLRQWIDRRRAQGNLEAQDLIRKLMVFEDSERYPLSAHGILGDPASARVRETFPNFESDSFEAQAALAFLLFKNRISVTTTLGPSFAAELGEDVDLFGQGLKEGDLINPPIAFDFSHQAHREVQAMMWARLFKVTDGLISLLKSEEYADGQSFWDRTLIYIATDFGRDKVRPAGAENYGTSHHLNNGFVLISPMVQGNHVLGGVDPNTGLTYGFDPRTGAPEPGRNMVEKEIFSGILGALGVDTSGANLPDVPAMRKGA